MSHKKATLSKPVFQAVWVQGCGWTVARLRMKCWIWKSSVREEAAHPQQRGIFLDFAMLHLLAQSTKPTIWLDPDPCHKSSGLTMCHNCFGPLQQLFSLTQSGLSCCFVIKILSLSMELQEGKLHKYFLIFPSSISTCGCKLCFLIEHKQFLVFSCQINYLQLVCRFYLF